jgi:class 3 adenylate cyclase
LSPPSSVALDARAALAASIERAVLDQARRNELIAAYVRVAALWLGASMSWLASVVRPDIPFAQHGRVAIFATTYFVYSAALVVLLRRGWYRPFLRAAIPFLDALFTAIVFINCYHVFGPELYARTGIFSAATVCCTVLASSSATRLSRANGVWVTLLATASFAAIGLVTLPPVEWTSGLIFSTVLMIGAGLFGVLMTDTVRQAVASEVSLITLRRFLPERVIRGAYDDPLDLVTAPRNVEATILISDLRGFTAFSETLAPGEVLAFLNEIQGAFAAVVREQGGTVDKFMGDGMLAVFGAPQPLPDHAARAVAAAKLMRSALASINASRSTSVRMGVGVHSGNVVVGCLGSGERLEFTVIGDTVNTSSRLEGLTKEKAVDVLVSDETARRLPEAARGDLHELGEVAIRGRKEALRVLALAPAVSG